MKLLILRAIVLLSVLCFLVSYRASAQGMEYFYNGRGEPFLKRYDPNIEGDPYFTDKWLPGKVNTIKGLYDNVKIKYDIYDDVVIFVNDTSEDPMKFIEQVKSFVLIMPSHQMTFAKGYPDVDKQTSGSFYQVLSSGKATLLKRFSKVVVDSKNYNSTVTRSFQITNAYYLFKDGKMEKIDPKKVLYTLAGSKKSEIDAYAKANSLGFKKDEDLALLFDYYNAKLI